MNDDQQQQQPLGKQPQTEIHFYMTAQERNTFRQQTFELVSLNATEERGIGNNDRLIELSSKLLYLGIDNFYVSDFISLNQLAVLKHLDLEIRDGNDAFGPISSFNINIPTLQNFNLVWENLKEISIPIREASAPFGANKGLEKQPSDQTEV